MVVRAVFKSNQSRDQTESDSETSNKETSELKTSSSSLGPAESTTETSPLAVLGEDSGIRDRKKTVATMGAGDSKFELLNNQEKQNINTKKKEISETVPMGYLCLRIVATIYFYCLMSCSLIVCVSLQAISYVALFPLFFVSEKWRLVIPGLILRLCSTCAGFWLNPFWKLKIVRPAPPGYSPSDTLVMVNHSSAADPWACATALFPWEFKYVFKADLLKIPIAGWSIGMAQDLPVHFTKEKGGWGTKPGSVAAMMQQAKRNMAHGVGTLVFPEGTRSKTGGLQPFKPGFFKFAIENKCEILPCVLHNQKRLWPLGSHLLGVGKAYFCFGDPIRVTDNDTVDGLMLKVRNQMLDMLPLCPLFDPEVEKPTGTIAEGRGLGISGKTTSST